jgi:FkbH-like protein
MSHLPWLPKSGDWQHKIAALKQENDPATWQALCELANARLDFAESLRLDRAFMKRFGNAPPGGLATQPIRLAILASGTVEQLLPGLRAGALRRGLWLTVHVTGYGQYLQELLDPASALRAFQPNAVLFALDEHHLFGSPTRVAGANSAETVLDEVGARLRSLWTQARDHFGCQVIQQTVVPLSPSLLGNNEHRLAHSQRRLTTVLNERLRALSDAGGVDLLALDDRMAMDGCPAWHDPLLWLKARQEISPRAGALYGDLVGRLLAARQGRSAKCLVLDLDHTLWGGVIGDDGLEGIRLGQGSAEGEAFLAIQRYALELSRRGVVLAICSKNDEANALLPFARHPEMILKRTDFACFVANWNDKASNLREIARRTNLGLDAMVFIDDNPFERNIVRRELPMVAVPELPEEPALFPQMISDAGYFEALHLTDEDRERAGHYQANQSREELKVAATDMEGYLRSLQMKLEWRRFDEVGLQRIVQLIHKTNQFNLTTKRYTEAEVRRFMDDARTFTLQLRLRDRFGDNGMIGVVIARGDGQGGMEIDTWLMSCRVLGRGVEEATLGLMVDEARRMKAERLVGEFRPTAKNGLVRDHYTKMGFLPMETLAEGGARWQLQLDQFISRPSSISVQEIIT